MQQLMSFLASPLISTTRLFSATGAVCKINGEVVPCEKLWEGFKWFAGIGAGVAVIFFIIGILLFIFWLKMIIHAVRQPIEHKPIWILVLLLTGLVGAIIYYFAVKRSTKVSPPPPPIQPTAPTPTP